MQAHVGPEQRGLAEGLPTFRHVADVPLLPLITQPERKGKKWERLKVWKVLGIPDHKPEYPVSPRGQVQLLDD